ncbi:MAG: hypothetical protein FJY82_15060 [Candidatus Aminicenantes bacterium]|nr:hypothetical protein [Candidatus Aminicenantes bacterium]
MNNVVLLTVDALRKDVLGCYGNPRGLTPFLDSIQNRCLRFDKAQACGPYTQAAFPGLLTSSHYLDEGKPQGLSLRKTLISEPLKDAGIATAGFHSNVYLSRLTGWDRGWDVFYDSLEEDVDERIPYVRGPIMNRKAENWLRSYRQPGRPFFLWLHYMDVHEPYMPERGDIESADPTLTLGPDEMFGLFQSVLLKRDVSDPRRVELLKRLYDVQIREVDSHIREFFASLERLGLLEETSVILTSDHGDEFNEHGGLSHDDKLYAELIDIPLLIYEPKRRAGGIGPHLVSGLDIAPTILHLFGLPPDKNFAGRSLLPAEAYSPSGCFMEALYHEPGRGEDVEKDVYGYREGDLKVIYRANLDRWEMYDLSRDPRETTNIVETSPLALPLKSRLQPRIRRWLSP